VSDPYNDMGDAQDAETTERVEAERDDGNELVYRGPAASVVASPPRIGLPSGNASGKPVDGDKVLVSSRGIQEWVTPSPGEQRPAGIEIPEALDLDAFYATNFEKISRKLSVLFRGDVSHAEDITQEAFVVAYRYWSRIEKMANPYGYVAKIAWNLTMKWLRTQRRNLQACVDLAVITVSEVPSADVGTHVDLGRALDRLPEQQRVVAGLSLLGYGSNDIAAILGIPPATARSRLKRARDRLIELLAEPEEGPQA